MDPAVAADRNLNKAALTAMLKDSLRRAGPATPESAVCTADAIPPSRHGKVHRFIPIPEPVTRRPKGDLPVATLGNPTGASVASGELKRVSGDSCHANHSSFSKNGLYLESRYGIEP